MRLLTALLFSAMAATAMCPGCRGQKRQVRQTETARVQAKAVRAVAGRYLAFTASDDTCPTVEMLVKAKQLPPKHANDPWGQPFVIECIENNIMVRSNGPDRQQNTADDIVVGPDS